MRSKEEAERELSEMFKINIDDVKEKIVAGAVEEMTLVVDHIYKNIDDFPQVDRRWVCDRRSEIIRESLKEN